MRRRLKLSLVLIMCLIITFINAQEKTKIRGLIKDAQTDETLPFVHVSFAGTSTGTVSDNSGVFFLNTPDKVDTLKFSYIGYKTLKYPIQQVGYQEINVKLNRSEVSLGEIVVKAGENPAYRIMRNVIKNKKRNNPDKLKSYQCGFYNKTNISVYNISDKTLKRIFKKDSTALNNLDTSEISGKPCLPIFFAETFSDYWYRKNPQGKKEVIKKYKSNSIGLDDVDLAEYMGNLSINTNLYDNFILIFGKSFVSPISSTWHLSYEYYILDSAYINNTFCYHLKFKPRRKYENTFTGDFWVHDSTFAITKIRARISETANLNFANDVQIEQEYVLLDDSTWFTRRSKQYIDFNLVDKKAGETEILGIIGERTFLYNNIKLNPEFSQKFFSGESSLDATEIYNKIDTINWTVKRPERLSKKENEVIETIDIIKESPIVKQTEKLFRMFSTGFYSVGKFEIGPYFNFYSYNPLEEHRFVFSARTSREYSKRVMYGGYVAYGTKDKNMKFGMETAYRFKKYPRFAMGISASHDIGQLGVNKKIEFLRENRIITSEDNFISSVLRRRLNYRLSMIDNFEYYIEKEWYRGFKNILYFNYNVIHNSDSLNFYKYDHEAGDFNSYSEESITTKEITLNTRISFNEDILDLYFRRISLRTPFPIFNINFTYGFHDLFDDNNSYYKANLIMKHKANIKVLGQFRYVIDLGLIRGSAPFPVLELHRANETWSYYNYAFNMLNYYEFVSDTYINFYAEHHFNGLILGKIPLMRRLQWRSTITGRALYGMLNDEHKKIMKFPLGTNPVKKPYYEVGAGVENIFKVLRVEAVWRLSYLNKPDIIPFGIRARIQITL